MYMFFTLEFMLIIFLFCLLFIIILIGCYYGSVESKPNQKVENIKNITYETCFKTVVIGEFEFDLNRKINWVMVRDKDGVITIEKFYIEFLKIGNEIKVKRDLNIFDSDQLFTYCKIVTDYECRTITYEYERNITQSFKKLQQFNEDKDAYKYVDIIK